ncbi:MAG: hypothetical protein LBV67_09300 [Streptococcaceae bacterium]|jgi:DNA-binding transcriptional regulator YhcF (GntR family)|nr:hypothetical protein [Streptococcaceae bacterium]
MQKQQGLEQGIKKGRKAERQKLEMQMNKDTLETVLNLKKIGVSQEDILKSFPKSYHQQIMSLFQDSDYS